MARVGARASVALVLRRIFWEGRRTLECIETGNARGSPLGVPVFLALIVILRMCSGGVARARCTGWWG